ncbi:conserved hypothetical protein [Paenibacillus curdlanolyticus YK9]|uniref:TadE family protein n=1 Tax=Paenibacillus curdlanolyticus YK9 TaxID=717606 RepID=E0I6T7_9BACL|nr:pilus assembly protein [Paenibacillus curdlanolyticus]EFM11753.1 conserved hypothetical protein [Paenibacillus curdlanolyticus YK9]
MIKRIKSLIADDSGSYTLEATVVFPVLFAIIAALLLFMGYMYEKAVLYGAASVTSERTAFLWDNSKRDRVTGLAEDGAFDGLYWRLGEDHMLDALFGLATGEADSGASVVIGRGRGGGQSEQAGTEDDSLAERKLARDSVYLRESAGGENRYKRGAFDRQIETALRLPVDINLLNQWLGRSEPQALSGSVIVEPTEFIRSVDLLRYYTSKFGNRSSAGGAAKRKEAGQVIQLTAKKKTSSTAP